MQTLRTLLVVLAALTPIVPALGAERAASSPSQEGDSLAEPLDVVATIPDLADLIRAVGGDRVRIKVLARPGQNLHAVRVKPSHLVAVKRADLFVQVGLSLEHAWVPGLLQTARNRGVLPGNDGFVSAAEGYEAIEIPVRMDRALSADVHPQGNPHMNLSFDGGPYMIRRIKDALVKRDPAHAPEYERNCAAWMVRYEAARARWDSVAEAVSAKKAAACLYHTEFDYLLGSMGLEIAAFLEPRPGLAPTPSHLATVVSTVRERSIPVVLTAPWSNNKNVNRVVDLTGAKALELAVMVDGEGGRTGWIELIDDCVDRIARAYGVDPKEVERRRRAVPAAADVDQG